MNLLLVEDSPSDIRSRLRATTQCRGRRPLASPKVATASPQPTKFPRLFPRSVSSLSRGIMETIEYRLRFPSRTGARGSTGPRNYVTQDELTAVMNEANDYLRIKSRRSGLRPRPRGHEFYCCRALTLVWPPS
jgi:hypothetical protein